MIRRFKVTVYEHITEAFDTEVEVDVPEDVSDDDLHETLAEEIERVRVEETDERRFLGVDDTDYEVGDEVPVTADEEGIMVSQQEIVERLERRARRADNAAAKEHRRWERGDGSCEAYEELESKAAVYWEAVRIAKRK